MLVQINKAGRHHQPSRVNHARASKRSLTHRHNLPRSNPDIPHRIQRSLRIHHPPAMNHQVIPLLRKTTTKQ